MSSLVERRAALARQGDAPRRSRGEGGAKALSSALPCIFAHATAWERARGRVGKPIVENLGTIELGDRVQLNCAFTPVRLYAGPGAILRMGDDVNVNFGTDIAASRSASQSARASPSDPTW